MQVFAFLDRQADRATQVRGLQSVTSCDHGGVPRVAIILPTDTYRARDFVPAAHRLGVDLTVVSEKRQLLADEMGAGFLLADCSQPEAAVEAVVRFAEVNPIDAIVAPDDQGVLIAALAAERLGLPHNPPFAVAATRNKVQLRRALRGKVRQPQYQVSDVTGDVGAVASHVRFPVVLKPISLSGSRGVIRADTVEEAVAASDRIRIILTKAGRNPNEPILIERFVPGIEVALEGILRDGRLEVLAIMDKPDPLNGPFFEETIYVTPSRLHPEMQEEVIGLTRDAVAALGLVHGPVHAEVRIDRSMAVLIELAARPIGGLCGRALQFGLLGTTLEELILESVLGLTRNVAGRAPASTGVMMLPIPATGILQAVDGIAEAQGQAGITSVEITAPIGERIEALPDGDRYLGFMFASADDPAETEAALRKGFEQLTIRIGGALAAPDPV